MAPSGRQISTSDADRHAKREDRAGRERRQDERPPRQRHDAPGDQQPRRQSTRNQLHDADRYAEDAEDPAAGRNFRHTGSHRDSHESLPHRDTGQTTGLPTRLRGSRDALDLEAEDNLGPLESAHDQRRASSTRSERPASTLFSGSRQRAAQPAVTGPLDPLLAKFVGFGTNQFSNCCTFCKDNPKIWELKVSVIERLLEVAKMHLRSGSSEAADRVIQRFLLLTTDTWLPEQLQKFSARQVVQLAARQDNNASSIRRLLLEACKRLRKTLEQQIDQEANKSDTRTQESRDSRVDLDTSRYFGDAPVHETSVTYGNQHIGIAEALTAQQRTGGAYVETLRGFRLFRGHEQINKVFGRGSIVAVFWHENLGSKLPANLRQKMRLGETALEPGVHQHGPGFVTLTRNRTIVFSHIKRFVIVAQRHGFSTGLPVTTYSGNGLSQKEIPVREQLAHSIVYSEGRHPVRVTGEIEFTKDPICVRMLPNMPILHPASRLHFAKPFSIEHNIQVKHLGHVVERDVPALVANYRNEVVFSYPSAPP